MLQHAEQGLLARQCDICRKKDGLLRCSGCQCVYYCGTDHQISDRPAHKKRCQAVKKLLASLKKEDQALRDFPGDFMTAPNPFESGAGHFWGIHETRPYMRARYALVDELLMSFGWTGGRVDVVQIALDHLMDMMHLCWSDNMGLRHVTPPLMIRLGKDQEAYDFLYWWATTGQESNYDWGSGERYLNIHGADILGPLQSSWTNRFLNLSHVSCIALLKVRALLDLQASQNASRALSGTVPQEIIQMIRGELISSIGASKPEILLDGVDDIARLIQTIKGQIRELYTAMNKSNPHFIPMFLDDAINALGNRPNMYAPGSPEEAALTIGQVLPAWFETPGSIDLLQSIRTTTK